MWEEDKRRLYDVDGKFFFYIYSEKCNKEYLSLSFFLVHNRFRRGFDESYYVTQR